MNRRGRGEIRFTATATVARAASWAMAQRPAGPQEGERGDQGRGGPEAPRDCEPSSTRAPGLPTIGSGRRASSIVDLEDAAGPSPPTRPTTATRRCGLHLRRRWAERSSASSRSRRWTSSLRGSGSAGYSENSIRIFRDRASDGRCVRRSAKGLVSRNVAALSAAPTIRSDEGRALSVESGSPALSTRSRARITKPC